MDCLLRRPRVPREAEDSHSERPGGERQGGGDLLGDAGNQRLSSVEEGDMTETCGTALGERQMRIYPVGRSFAKM